MINQFPKNNNLCCYKVYKHTAGEDQLPQESANVTKGSDHSNPNMLLAFTSSFFAAFGHVY
jgi:hypothetical protein